MQDLHASFMYQNMPMQIDLVKNKGTNSLGYSVQGLDQQLEIAKQIISSISLETITSPADLEGMLKQLTGVSQVQVISRVHQVGIQSLGTYKPAMHVWQEAEQAQLPKHRELLAQALWQNRDTNSYPGLKGFLGPDATAKFEAAVEANKFEVFLTIFDEFSSADIRNTYQAEGLPMPIGVVKAEAYTITKEDITNLKQYLDDVGFSGVVYLSDAKARHCICPTDKEALESKSFCMHSIGKVFTGTLSLLTMPKEAFNKPLALEPAVVAALPKPLRAHLAIPTLKQVMEHRGGFGDYLNNYQTAIEQALERREPLPVINCPEDFLRYAEDTRYPLDKVNYSNLGILLVALAVQNHCKEPFETVLQKHILEPSHTYLTTTKPEDSQWNKADSCQGETVGGPAGGYWTTPESLHGYGTWLRDKCMAEPSFEDTLKEHGQEFYIPEDREIRHNGNSSAGSAMLSSFLDSGITIAILSDQSDFKADEIYYAIRSNLVEERE